MRVGTVLLVFLHISGNQKQDTRDMRCAARTFQGAGTMSMSRSSGFPAGARSRFLKPCLAAVAILCLTAIEARATFTTYGLSGGSGVYAVSCGGLLVPGSGLGALNAIDNRDAFQTGSSACTSDALTSSSNTSFTDSDFTAFGSGTASLGSITGAATLDTGFDPFGPFPTGYTDTGWVDTMIIDVPGQDAGTFAFLNAVIVVSGELDTTGVNVIARFRAIASSDLGSPGEFQQFYQEQSFNQIQETLTVSDTLFFALPFLIGQPFQFTVRGQATAQTSSSTSGGLVGGFNFSDVDFSSSVNWLGIESISIDGEEIFDFTALGTDSLINWANAVGGPVPPTAVPAPPALPLFLLGLATLVLMRHLTRRSIAAERTQP